VDMDLGVRGKPGLHLWVLVGAVVVHNQVQLTVGVAAGEVAQEHQELLDPGFGFGLNAVRAVCQATPR
jgi:hypothetical protein